MYPRKEFHGPRDFWRKVSTELKRRGQEKKRQEESKRIYLIKPGGGGEEKAECKLPRRPSLLYKLKNVAFCTWSWSEATI